MDLSSTCVDLAMEVLANVDWDLSPHAMDQIWALSLDLKFLRTFLQYAFWFNDADETAALGSLLTRVEAAFTEGAADLRAAYEEGNESRGEQWGLEISKLQQKIQLFMLEIEIGYELLSNQSLTMDYRLLNKFVDSVMEQVFVVDIHKANLIVPVKGQIKALKDKLRQLTYMSALLAKCCSEHRKFNDFLTHLQAVILRTAHLSYLCWIREMDEDARKQMIELLNDLHQKITADITEMIDVYLEVLKASKTPSDSEIVKNGVTSFLDFLLYAGDRNVNLLEGLESLVNFFVGSPKESSGDAQLILKDIKAVIEEAASLCFSFHVDVETEAVKGIKNAGLLKFHQKIKLISAEVSLIELLKRETSLILPFQYQITTLQKGLRFLTTFFMDTIQEDTVDVNFYRTYSEGIATKAASFCHSIHAIAAKELMVQKINHELTKLLERFQLVKVDGLLMEILESNASFVVSLKDKIKLLQSRMKFVRMFLSGLPEEFEEEEETLVLESSEAVAKKATSLFYSLHENKINVGVDVEMNLLLKEIEHVTARVIRLYLEHQNSWVGNRVYFTNELEFIDFLLGNIKELLTSDSHYIASVKSQIEMVQGNLQFVRSFLKDSRRTGKEHKELKDLRKSILRLANEATGVIRTFSAKRRIVWYCAIWLFDVIQVTEHIKMNVMEIIGKKSRLNDFMVNLKDQEEVIIDHMTDDFILKDQEEAIRDQLFGGSLEQNIVSIVGMPGIGKTTLAMKIYSDSQVEDHFLRAWSCVSQNSRRREILLDILSNNFELPNNIFAMTDDDLCEELNKCLKGKRYLIVLDDLRSVSAWYSIRQAFPDDRNGSRILITTRFHNVALRAKRGSDPLPLRLLSDHECWRLLQVTVFPSEGCPGDLLVLGNKIAKSCTGLPLAVVTIGRLLERRKEECHWKYVADCISSPDDDPQKQLMKILELSYNLLPSYLKRCFLYFGAFLQDKDIAVWKLICLWIAEGLVRQKRVKSPEDVAEEYLLDLIDSGLIVVAKRRSNGRVKTCRLHDMVRILWLAKAKNETLFQLVPSDNDPFGASNSNGGLDYGVDSEHSGSSASIMHQCHRICVHSETKHFIRSRPSCPVVHSLLCFEADDMFLGRHSDISFICHNFKALSVLDLECINMLSGFPVEIGLLVQLRYLAVKGDINVVPSSIGNLSKLETFLLKGSRGEVVLPRSLWRLTTLRHVYVDGHFTFTGEENFFGKNFFALRNLITLSTVVLSSSSQLALRLYASNVRKLRCIYEESQDSSRRSNHFPALIFPSVETMKIFSRGARIHPKIPFHFPSRLKSLTLKGFRLPWKQIVILALLHNLEVLKLLSRAFEGHILDMAEFDFKKLKFLKLDGLDIRQWNGSEDCFPVLQRLVLRDCKLLAEVPSSFAYIPTLEMIEVKSCSRLVMESVMKIREAQQRRGNEGFKILTRNEWYCISSASEKPFHFRNYFHVASESLKAYISAKCFCCFPFFYLLENE